MVAQLFPSLFVGLLSGGQADRISSTGESSTAALNRDHLFNVTPRLYSPWICRVPSPSPPLPLNSSTAASGCSQRRPVEKFHAAAGAGSQASGCQKTETHYLASTWPHHTNLRLGLSTSTGSSHRSGGEVLIPWHDVPVAHHSSSTRNLQDFGI